MMLQGSFFTKISPSIAFRTILPRSVVCRILPVFLSKLLSIRWSTAILETISGKIVFARDRSVPVVKRKDIMMYSAAWSSADRISSVCVAVPNF